jgi:hypothetical protein
MKDETKVTEGDVMVKLTCPLLKPVERMVDMGLESTGPTPGIMGLTRKTLDNAISLEAKLAFLWNGVFQLQDGQQVLSSEGNPF